MWQSCIRQRKPKPKKPKPPQEEPKNEQEHEPNSDVASANAGMMELDSSIDTDLLEQFWAKMKEVIETAEYEDRAAGGSQDEDGMCDQIAQEMTSYVLTTPGLAAAVDHVNFFYVDGESKGYMYAQIRAWCDMRRKNSPVMDYVRTLSAKSGANNIDNAMAETDMLQSKDDEYCQSMTCADGCSDYESLCWSTPGCKWNGWEQDTCASALNAENNEFCCIADVAPYSSAQAVVAAAGV